MYIFYLYYLVQYLYFINYDTNVSRTYVLRYLMLSSMHISIHRFKSGFRSHHGRFIRARTSRQPGKMIPLYSPIGKCLEAIPLVDSSLTRENEQTKLFKNHQLLCLHKVTSHHDQGFGYKITPDYVISLRNYN